MKSGQVYDVILEGDEIIFRQQESGEKVNEIVEV